MDTNLTATPTMATAGISWIDVERVAEHCIDALEKIGPAAIDGVRCVMKMVAGYTARDLTAVFAALSAAQADVKAIIEAIRAEFGS